MSAGELQQDLDRHPANPGTLEWTPELRAEVLDAASWGKILALFANTVKLAVALVDSDGRLIGSCQNPQPIWTLARTAKPQQPGSCLFCLETGPQCTAAAESLRTNSVTLAHDQAGFAHLAFSLVLGDRHVGWLLAGQVLDRYPELLPLQRAAREFGLLPQQLWNLSRRQAPLSRASLAVYGELLAALGQTFLRDRYSAILQSRSAERTESANRELAIANSTLRKAERLAKEARSYAESILASVPEPLLVLDDTFHIRSANPAFYAKFQLSENETLGLLLFELSNGAWDLPDLRLLLTQLLPRNQWVQNFEMEHDFRLLGLTTMVLSARRIDDMELIVLSIHDITEQKQAEKSLIKLNLDLKHFAYAATHDMQEPLRMVKLFTQLLSRDYRGKFESKADRYLTVIVESATRIETLLRDLREYWLVSEGIKELVPVDCNLVLERVLVALQVSLEESGAIVTHDPLPMLLAQEVSLMMLLQNLVGNAIKYRRPDEPPVIHVSAIRIGGSWRVSVQDQGIGIEPEYVAHIFAPFKRLHGKEYPGTGIGLALCSKIVERYGGKIWVESVAGQGSTFYFTVPLHP